MSDLKSVMTAVRFKTYLISLDALSRKAVIQECKAWVQAAAAHPTKDRVLNWLQAKELEKDTGIQYCNHELWIPFFTLAKEPTFQDLFRAMDL